MSSFPSADGVDTSSSSSSSSINNINSSYLEYLEYLNSEHDYNATASSSEFIESPFVKTFFITLWLLLALFGIIGNGLVIFIAIFYKKLNEITNCYIFNLAVTDLLFVIFCIPFTTYVIAQHEWQFGVVFCKLSNFMSHASVQSTILTLTAMTIHRCRLIIKNKIQSQNSAKLKERQMNVLMITTLIWITSFLISSPYIIYYTLVPTYENSTEFYCMIQQSDNAISKFYVNASQFITIATTYVLPLLIIVFSYALLLSHLTKNQKRLAKFNTKLTRNGSGGIGSGGGCEDRTLLENTTNRRMSLTDTAKRLILGSPSQQAQPPSNLQLLHHQPSSSHRHDMKKKRVTTMVALVTLNFGICWLPTHLLIVAALLIRRSVQAGQVNLADQAYLYNLMALFKLVAHTLSYLTPCINPLVYAFYNENFRLSFFQLWKTITCADGGSGGSRWAVTTAPVASGAVRTPSPVPSPMTAQPPWLIGRPRPSMSVSNSSKRL